MNLLEHHAKTLLATYGLPVPSSWLVRPSGKLSDDVTYPVVAKSQVPVGGRGKAGGIIVADDRKQAEEAIKKIFELPIKGHLPTAVLLEEKFTPHRELYISVRLNRDTRSVEWLVSAEGGVDIESNADSITVINDNDPSLQDSIAASLRLPTEVTKPLVDGLRRAFLESDLLLLEINPLIETDDQRLVCADAKCLVDDNARFRHPELPWPLESGNTPKPLGGTIGCIANGAGMAMSTMDTIVAMGGKPANFLDIGGGTGEKEFVQALRNIMNLPQVTSVVINIFAGISRCDEIARGIVAAKSQLDGLPPLFIRLEGTNRDIALQILKDANVAVEADLSSCIKKAMEVSA